MVFLKADEEGKGEGGSCLFLISLFFFFFFFLGGGGESMSEATGQDQRAQWLGLQRGWSEGLRQRRPGV